MCVLSYKYKESTHFDFCLVKRVQRITVFRYTNSPPWLHQLKYNTWRVYTRCLSLLQKSKDIFYQIISSLWKGHNNKIRFQTKDDVIARPDGTVRKRFELRGTNNLKDPNIFSAPMKGLIPRPILERGYKHAKGWCLIFGEKLNYYGYFLFLSDKEKYFGIFIEITLMCLGLPCMLDKQFTTDHSEILCALVMEWLVISLS